MRRKLLVALALACLPVFGACYGSTEPATDVGAFSAVLHGQGTANNGRAQSYFEYWLTDEPAGRIETPVLGPWPDGASGRFSYELDDLGPDREYSFRMCGFDVDQSPIVPVCAQTRTFHTLPDFDSVHGSATNSSGEVEVDAVSGANGESPFGTVRLVVNEHTVVFSVGCLDVDGSTAVVGFNPDGRPLATFYGRVVDSGIAGQDTFDYQGGAYTSSPACDLYEPDGSPVFIGDFTVKDARLP